MYIAIISLLDLRHSRPLRPQGHDYMGPEWLLCPLCASAPAINAAAAVSERPETQNPSY